MRGQKTDSRAETDPWIYQWWDQMPRRYKHPYKHGPPGNNKDGIKRPGLSIPTNMDPWIYRGVSILI
jgi:hypothetical protein